LRLLRRQELPQPKVNKSYLIRKVLLMLKRLPLPKPKNKPSNNLKLLNPTNKPKPPNNRPKPKKELPNKNLPEKSELSIIYNKFI
jgi:hypothetical protein